MSQIIHSSAFVHPDAQLGADVVIGPFCIIGPCVSIGVGTRLASYVTISGHTDFGHHNVLGHFSSFGSAPQDVRYNGEQTRLVVGDRNVIDQGVTFNGALLDRAYPTTIGNDGIFKKGAHVAHDCVVGDGVVFEIGAAIAGHCRISNGVHIGTLSAVQQFTRIGTFAKIEDGCAVTSDVIPFGVASSSEVHVRFNADGARQSGLCDADVALVEELFGRLIGGDRALHRYARHRHILAARQIIAFIEAKNPNVIPAAPR